jgi:hypothetical protein
MQNKANRYVTNNDMVIQLYKNFGVNSSIWCVLSYTKGWHTKPVSWKDARWWQVPFAKQMIKY